MTDASEGKIAGLRRHRLFRIATVYAVAGWLLIQAADIILEAFDSPAWIMRAFLITVVVGFPVTLTGIWLLERTQERSHSKPIGSILIIGAALLVSAGAYLFFSAEGDDVESNPATGRESNPVLAVLPFASMSSAEDNAYLADGLTEDVITLLAQSPGLEVIARNSTFKYKNQNPDIREVGRDLDADYVVEGSVRPIGERIRVTVQVIDSGSGAHIWAEKYDRPFADFFEIQDDVSLGVAAAVGDAVFREEYSQINQSRTANLSAWALTSQAEAAFSHEITGDENGVLKARQAVELDPDYALAHAMLGRALALNSFRDASVAEEAEAEARLALRLDSHDPKVNAYLAFTLLALGQPVEALSYAERATKISPSYAEGLIYYADILTHNGRSRESLPYFDKAIRLTPNAPQLAFYHWLHAEAFVHHGNFTDAEASLVTANRMFRGTNQVLLHLLAGVQLRLGKPEEARARLAESKLLGERSIGEDQAMWELFSSDGGGEHYESMWEDLKSLATSASP